MTSTKLKTAFVVGMPLVLAGAAIVIAVQYYLIQIGPQRPVYVVVQDVSRSPRDVIISVDVTVLTERIPVADGVNLKMTYGPMGFKVGGVDCTYNREFLGRRGVCDLWRFDFDGTTPPGKHSKTVKFCGDPVEIWRSGSYAITLEPTDPLE